MRGLTQGVAGEGFRHEALFYAGPEEFLERTAWFIRAGVEAGEPVLAVLSAPKLDALRSRLNGEADQVRFADMAEVGGNPARIIPAWSDFVAEYAGGGRGLRGIGEPIWAERAPAELVECQLHESLLNLAFADTPSFHLLCPYDTEALDADVLDEARHSHPFLIAGGEPAESQAYEGLDGIAPFAPPLPEPGSRPHTQVFQAGTLAVLRRFVSGRGAAAGLGARAIEDLVLAVDEVATNSVVHGGGGGVLRTWEEGDALICEVHDRGVIDQPLAGRERPTAGGHGLWMANQLCDLVQIRSFTDGSAVRLHQRCAR